MRACLNFLAGALCAALVAFSVAPGTITKRWEYKVLPLGEVRAKVDALREAELGRLRLRVNRDSDADAPSRAYALRTWLSEYAADGWRIASSSWALPDPSLFGGHARSDDDVAVVVLMREFGSQSAYRVDSIPAESSDQLIAALRIANASVEKANVKDGFGNVDSSKIAQQAPGAYALAVQQWLNARGQNGDMLICSDIGIRGGPLSSFGRFEDAPPRR